MTQPTVALTGGTGFLGRYCAVALAAAGWRIRLLVRRDPTHTLLDGVPVELVQGDLADDAALSRLVRGAQAVVHAAGAVRATSAAAFRATNTDGTGRLAVVVGREAPDCRFVHISSQAARCPELSPYAASKRAGEAAVQAALGGHAWAILRPCVIYGPWDASSMSLLRLASQPFVPVPRAPEPRIAMVHVRDVARAVLAFCDGGPVGRVFEVCDGAPDGHAWRDVVRLAGPGRAPPFVPLPDAVLLAAGGLTDLWSALARRPMIFGRGKAREILHRDWRPDPALRPPAPLWQPRIELSDGLRETRAWWRGERLSDGSQPSMPRPEPVHPGRLR